ncbi:MAG TPA: PDZ domain-containing protein [Bryobacteraceae bacterium]|nr:PDZ domain-containing protein [Bryobacteraceae bacterium]
MHPLVTLVCFASALMGADGPYLLQQPAMNKTHIVFVFAGDLWTVDRRGGAAARLTTGRGRESGPHFSPDGAMIAFTGEYDGNIDAYVIPASGGVPKRLTSHPGTDRVMGWTPDGKGVLFASARESWVFTPQLFSVPREGGNPEKLPFAMAANGSLSPDGTRLAYMPLLRADETWKRYRGGRATPIWIGNVSDSGVTAVPRKDSNDYNPMWIGNNVYFLSDRNGKATLFKYDTKSGQVAQVIDNKGLDLKWASAAADGIVYEQFGSIHTLDLKTGKTQTVNITLNGDLQEVRPRMEKVSRFARNANISPTGARAVFEARGEIFSVPADKGNARNLTGTPGVAERDPAWSPDGKWVAFFSDESGEYMLHLAPQSGMGEVKKLGLSKPASFYYSPVWSPDSKKIAYMDKKINLWYIDLEKRTPVQVDHGTYQNWEGQFEPSWSPDSKWLAYTKDLKNHLNAICLYALDGGKPVQITDGMSDARFPVWDKNGKYLYLTASTDAGPARGSLDLSTWNRPVTRNVYAAVLSKSDPSPLAPESDEEKIIEEKKAEEKKPPEKKGVEVRIDLDGISQRTIPLPLPARNYVGMDAGKTGILFLIEAPSFVDFTQGPGQTTLQRFDLAKRKAEKVGEGIGSLVLSANGEKMLVRRGGSGGVWSIVGTAGALKPGDGRLRMDELEMQVDPVAEWKQMYKEVLRIERDFFYDPGYHGLDLQALGERYEKYLKGLGSREDLNYLWKEMLGELTVGHLYVTGGDTPEAPKVRGGLLGADYKVENGRYRFARIFNGENWNPETRAPLTQPGVNVNTGDYLLAVNGKEVRASEELYSYFEGTARKNTVLRVGPDPSGAAAREVTVVPIETELPLRRLAWIEGNRRRVDEASGGKLAYVYLPDTFIGGYTYFNRYYFAQVDKQGVVLDERFNSGGKAADYIIDHLQKRLWGFWTTRDGEDYTTPVMAIFGPKVMIINEYAGSGGDALPWFFRRGNIGPLIGKRTWGGLVGIGGYPVLIDGGMVTAPHFAFWNPDGKWDVENFGTPPDIDIELDPKAWREGKDTQLEKAIEVAMELLKKHPAPVRKKPPYPSYQTRTAATPSGVQ